MIHRTLLVLTLGSLAFATPVFAHNPFCACEKVDDATIRCQGGFSDGASAEGVKLDVISYGEEVLLPGKFGSDSVVEFKKPEGEFYILFDAGPGHVVEVDHLDIQ
jgi:hypothetical protein